MESIRERCCRLLQETARWQAIAGSELLTGERGKGSPRFDVGKTRGRSGDHGELTKGDFADGDEAEMASCSMGSTESSCRRSAASCEQTENEWEKKRHWKLRHLAAKLGTGLRAAAKLRTSGSTCGCSSEDDLRRRRELRALWLLQRDRGKGRRSAAHHLYMP
jgi:hypothetical protein